MDSKNILQGNSGKYLGLAIGLTIATVMTVNSGGFVMENFFLIPFYFTFFTIVSAKLGRRFLSSYVNRVLASPSKSFLMGARVAFGIVAGYLGAFVFGHLLGYLFNFKISQSFWARLSGDSLDSMYAAGFTLLIVAVLASCAVFAVCFMMAFKLSKHWIHPN